MVRLHDTLALLAERKLDALPSSQVGVRIAGVGTFCRGKERIQGDVELVLSNGLESVAIKCSVNVGTAIDTDRRRNSVVGDKAMRVVGTGTGDGNRKGLARVNEHGVGHAVGTRDIADAEIERSCDGWHCVVGLHRVRGADVRKGGIKDCRAVAYWFCTAMSILEREDWRATYHLDEGNRDQETLQRQQR